MKNYLPKVFFVLFFITGWTTCSCAEGWMPATFDKTWVVVSEQSGSATVTTTGATINLTANGTIDGSFLGGLYKTTQTTGIAGMWATLRIDKLSGNCDLGLKADIGQIGNKHIQVLIYLAEYGGQKGVHWTIYMWDMTTHVSDTFASGSFGPWDGAWVPGKPQSVAFIRVGSELWFYADGYKQLHKIQLLDGIVPINGSVGGFVYASQSTDVSINSITGSISDIYLYYQ